MDSREGESESDNVDDAVRSCQILCSDQATTKSFDFLFKKSRNCWMLPCCDQHACFITDVCLQTLLRMVNRSASDATELLEVTKCLDRTMIILRSENICLKLDLQYDVFKFVRNFWNYIVEAVCYTCVSIFDSLMKIHFSSCMECRLPSCEWIRAVEEFLFESALLCKSRFRCILSFLKNAVVPAQLPANIISVLYSAVANPALSSAASEVIAYDFSLSLQDNAQLNLHTKHLVSVLKSTNERTRSAAVDKLLPTLCKNRLLAGWIAHDLVAYFSDASDELSLNTILCLVKLCLFSQRGSQLCDSWSDLISADLLMHGLLHAKSYLRLSAWALITEHPKTTCLISEVELNMMKIFLLANMSEQSPAARQKVLAGLKKIFIRIKGLYQMMIKSNEKSNVLCSFENFVLWLRGVCFNCIEKGANFNRRIMALQILDFIYTQPYLKDNDKDLFFRNVETRLRLTNEELSLLVACLDDSYQLCQSLAYGLLIFDGSHKFLPFEEFDAKKFFDESLAKMLSIRSHNTESSGFRIKFYLNKFPSDAVLLFDRCIELCQKRVELISDALTAIASEDGFLHAILNGIAVIVEELQLVPLSDQERKEWHNRLLYTLPQLCFKIVDVISPVVQSASPEGFLPSEYEPPSIEITGSDSGDWQNEFSQFLLASCWRAHKQVSKLFHLLLSKLSFGLLSSSKLVETVGDYYRTQLTECRHCGAFESAVDGFEYLCSLLWSEYAGDNSFSQNALPDAWLDEILAAIFDNKDTDRFCSARRSAGLPHLVRAILCTEPVFRNGASLRKCLSALFEFSHLNVALQIHCINILRGIFGESRLHEKLLWGLETALNRCIVSYASPFWPVRNASAQLFAALLNQIFGVPAAAQRSIFVQLRNRMSAYEFFSRFSSVYDLLYAHLSNPNRMEDEFKVFPVLSLLSHLYPSPLSSEHSLAKFVLPILRLLVSCNSEKLRHIAAGALVSICELQDSLFLVQWISTLNWSSLKQNQIHALLLLLSNLFERVECSSLQEIIKDYVSSVMSTHSYVEWCSYNLGQLIVLLNACLDSADSFFVDLVLLFVNAKCADLEPVCQVGMLLSKLLLRASNNDGLDFTAFMSILSADFKRQLWRELAENGCTVDPAKILEMAEDDFKSYEELVCCNILRTTINVCRTAGSEEYNAARKRLRQTVISRPPFKGKSTNDLAEAAQLLLCPSESIHDLDRLRGYARTEDSYNRYIVLSLVESLLARGFVSEDLAEICALLLQDDEADLREKVASSLSRAFNLGWNMCPQLALWFLLQKFTSVEGKAFGAFLEADDDRFFDPCASNVYAETRPFGIEYYRELQKHIKMPI